MKRSKQATFSALSILASVLLAANRYTQGAYGWAAMWAALCLGHCWIIWDIKKQCAKSEHCADSATERKS